MIWKNLEWTIGFTKTQSTQTKLKVRFCSVELKCDWQVHSHQTEARVKLRWLKQMQTASAHGRKISKTKTASVHGRKHQTAVVCITCHQPVQPNQDTIQVQQVNHSCSARSFVVHRTCIQTRLRDCTCPRFDIQHDRNPNQEPLFRPRLVNHSGNYTAPATYSDSDWLSVTFPSKPKSTSFKFDSNHKGACCQNQLFSILSQWL